MKEDGRRLPLEVIFRLKREDGQNYVSAEGICGYYLWTSDLERALASVIPLAQHLFWANGKDIRVPEGTPDTSQLLTGELRVTFLPENKLSSPTLLMDGFWMKSPSKRKFFIPQENRKTDGMIIRQIRADLDTGRLA